MDAESAPEPAEFTPVQMATVSKNSGNQAFDAGNWMDAIAMYDAGIQALVTATVRLTTASSYDRATTTTTTGDTCPCHVAGLHPFILFFTLCSNKLAACLQAGKFDEAEATGRHALRETAMARVRCVQELRAVSNAATETGGLSVGAWLAPPRIIAKLLARLTAAVCGAVHHRGGNPSPATLDPWAVSSRRWSALEDCHRWLGAAMCIAVAQNDVGMVRDIAAQRQGLPSALGIACNVGIGSHTTVLHPMVQVSGCRSSTGQAAGGPTLATCAEPCLASLAAVGDGIAETVYLGRGGGAPGWAARTNGGSSSAAVAITTRSVVLSELAAYVSTAPSPPVPVPGCAQSFAQWDPTGAVERAAVEHLAECVEKTQRRTNGGEAGGIRPPKRAAEEEEDLSSRAAVAFASLPLFIEGHPKEDQSDSVRCRLKRVWRQHGRPMAPSYGTFALADHPAFPPEETSLHSENARGGPPSQRTGATGSRAMAAFSFVSMLRYASTPNCVVRYDPRTLQADVVALRDIPFGEPLTVALVHPLTASPAGKRAALRHHRWRIFDEEGSASFPGSDLAFGGGLTCLRCVQCSTLACPAKEENFACTTCGANFPSLCTYEATLMDQVLQVEREVAGTWDQQETVSGRPKECVLHGTQRWQAAQRLLALDAQAVLLGPLHRLRYRVLLTALWAAAGAVPRRPGAVQALLDANATLLLQLAELQRSDAWTLCPAVESVGLRVHRAYLLGLREIAEQPDAEMTPSTRSVVHWAKRTDTVRSIHGLLSEAYDDYRSGLRGLGRSSHEHPVAEDGKISLEDSSSDHSESEDEDDSEVLDAFIERFRVELSSLGLHGPIDLQELAYSCNTPPCSSM